MSSQVVHKPIEKKLPEQPSVETVHPDVVIPTTKDGIASVLTGIDTAQPVVFLGIDDAAFKDPTVPVLLAKNHIKASLFCPICLFRSIQVSLRS